MKYTVQYFINKFRGIPNRKWCEGDWDNGEGQFCALGHTGSRQGYTTDEGKALETILDGRTMDINDEQGAEIVVGKDKWGHNKFVTLNQATPRARVIAALRLKLPKRVRKKVRKVAARLVEAARKSPALRPLFEWDDKVAAKKYAEGVEKERKKELARELELLER